MYLLQRYLSYHPFILLQPFHRVYADDYVIVSFRMCQCEVGSRSQQVSSYVSASGETRDYGVLCRLRTPALVHCNHHLPDLWSITIYRRYSTSVVAQFLSTQILTSCILK